MSEPSRRGDWVTDPRRYVLAWGIPTLALLAGTLLPPPARTVVWSLALVWMGAACVVNALRCGRMHCFLTGPFFLAMAAVTLLHGAGIVRLGANGWLWIGLTLVVVAGGLLWYLPERIWGRYVGGESIDE